MAEMEAIKEEIESTHPSVHSVTDTKATTHFVKPSSVTTDSKT